MDTCNMTSPKCKTFSPVSEAAEFIRSASSHVMK